MSAPTYGLSAAEAEAFDQFDPVTEQEMSKVMPLFVNFQIPALKLERKLLFVLQPRCYKRVVAETVRCVEELQASLSKSLVGADNKGKVHDSLHSLKGAVVRDFAHWQDLVDDWKGSCLKRMRQLQESAKEAEAKMRKAEKSELDVSQRLAEMEEILNAADECNKVLKSRVSSRKPSRNSYHERIQESQEIAAWRSDAHSTPSTDSNTGPLHRVQRDSIGSNTGAHLTPPSLSVTRPTGRRQTADLIRRVSNAFSGASSSMPAHRNGEAERDYEVPVQRSKYASGELGRNSIVSPDVEQAWVSSNSSLPAYASSSANREAEVVPFDPLFSFDAGRAHSESAAAAAPRPSGTSSAMAPGSESTSRSRRQSLVRAVSIIISTRRNSSRAQVEPVAF